MPTFELTARHDIHRANGLHICKGQQITININMVGITPINLFGSSRCMEQLTQQFRLNGIDVPKSDLSIYSRGAWNIQMK